MAWVAKCGRPCTVSEIAVCCAVDLAMVSCHLQLLSRAGILQYSKVGREVSYAVEYGQLCRAFRGLADAIEQCCPADPAGARAGGCRDKR